MHRRDRNVPHLTRTVIEYRRFVRNNILTKTIDLKRNRVEKSVGKQVACMTSKQGETYVRTNLKFLILFLKYIFYSAAIKHYSLEST